MCLYGEITGEKLKKFLRDYPDVICGWKVFCKGADGVLFSPHQGYPYEGRIHTAPNGDWTIDSNGFHLYAHRIDARENRVYSETIRKIKFNKKDVIAYGSFGGPCWIVKKIEILSTSEGR